MDFLIFDVETRVDKKLLRAIEFPAETISDEQAYTRLQTQLNERYGSSFIALSYHVPVSIVLGRVDGDYVLRELAVLGADERGEEGIVRCFWGEIEGFNGTLVSFNGRGFDLPVLELQALRWGCTAPRYFNQREGLRARYGRHYDLYDFLSNNGAARLRGGLDLLSKLVGLPGKGEHSGADVQGLWEAGRLDAIHRYCRRDVIQTYLLFLHVERLRGRLVPERFAGALAASQSLCAELDADRGG